MMFRSWIGASFLMIGIKKIIDKNVSKHVCGALLLVVEPNRNVVYGLPGLLGLGDVLHSENLVKGSRHACHIDCLSVFFCHVIY